MQKRNLYPKRVILPTLNGSESGRLCALMEQGARIERWRNLRAREGWPEDRGRAKIMRQKFADSIFIFTFVYPKPIKYESQRTIFQTNSRLWCGSRKRPSAYYWAQDTCGRFLIS